MAEQFPCGGLELSRQRSIRAFLWMLVCFLSFLTIAACCSTDTATVYVSHPQVFTRERLVVSRQRELQFLYTQLDKPIATGYQGAIDERLLSAFQGSVAANISPTPGAASQPSPALNMANLQCPLQRPKTRLQM